MFTEFWTDESNGPRNDAELSRGFIEVGDRATNLGSYYRRAVLGNEHIPTDDHLERFAKMCAEMRTAAVQEDRDAQFARRLFTDADFRARMVTELRQRRLISPEQETALLAADNEGKAP